MIKVKFIPVQEVRWNTEFWLYIVDEDNGERYKFRLVNERDVVNCFTWRNIGYIVKEDFPSDNNSYSEDQLMNLQSQFQGAGLTIPLEICKIVMEKMLSIRNLGRR